MARPRGPAKKELRVLFTKEHYERLERCADRLDMTTAALVRMWAMEKVAVLESLGSNSGALDFLKAMQEIADKREDS